MDVKKTREADLEYERTTFFLLGFTVVLASLFVLLEWTTEDTLSPNWEGFSTFFIEEEYQQPAVASAELQMHEAAPEKLDIQLEEPKAVYEDFHIVKEAPATEVNLSDWFDPAATEAETALEEAPKSQLSRQEVNERIYTEAEIMPEYPGGYSELNRYLFANLKYPASAVSQRIQGRVWCSFIVNQDGSVSDIRIERGVHVSLDQEAQRVLQSMRAWIPGSIRGNPVRVKVYLPIVFKL